MSNWLSIPLLLLAAFLQVTFVPQIRVLGGAPDLVFLLVVAWSINASLDTGVIWAFVGGVLADLMSAAPTGASVVGLVLLVFALHLIQQQLYGVTFLVLVGVVLVGTVFHWLVLAMVAGLAGYRTLTPANFTFVVLPTVAYNLAFILPVYWLVRRIQRRIEREGRFFR